MGDNETVQDAHDELERVLDHIHLEMSEIMQLYSHCLLQYTDSMLSSLNAKEYFSKSEFRTLHHNSRNGALQQVCNTNINVLNEMK